MALNLRLVEGGGGGTSRRDVEVVVARVMRLRVGTVDGVDEAARERGLVEERVIRTQEVVALVTRRAVVVHLTRQRDVRVVAVVASAAVELGLRNGHEERVFRQICAAKLVREVRVRQVVYHAPVRPRLVPRRQSGRRRGRRRLSRATEAPSAHTSTSGRLSRGCRRGRQPVVVVVVVIVVVF